MKQRLLGMICILGLLSGCGQGTQGALESVLQTVGGAWEPREASMALPSLEPTFQAPLYTDGQPAILWGREQLDSHAQGAYDQLSAGVAARRDTIPVDITEAEIQIVLEALRIDHPEYFWFDGSASFVATTLGDTVVRTECQVDYTMDLEEIRRTHDAIRAYTGACLAELEASGAATDYEKILGVYRYLIHHTDYIREEQDQTLVSAMTENRATCAGYARSFQYLMSQLDIPCTLALGEGQGGEAHGWNVVRCDGQWYQMDVTWGDPVEPDDTPGNSIQYTYCMVTDGEIYRDHTLVSELPMPECSATEYNYFVQAGRQFDTWDRDTFETAMTEAWENGETWFSVRFSGEESYRSALAALFDGEEIWDILQNLGAVSQGENRLTYSQNDLFYEIALRLEGGEEGETA